MVTSKRDAVGICVWVKFTGTKEGAKAILNTGASISLLPKRIYDIIERTIDVQMTKPDRRIIAANKQATACYGMAKIPIEIDGLKFKQNFYICADEVTVLLGRNFMKNTNVQLEPAANKIKIGGKRVTAYDLKGTKIRNTVNLITTMTIKPGQERQVWARVKGKGQPEDMVCMVEPSRSLLVRTGALAGRICTKPKNGKCMVRVLNASEDHVTLYKNTTVGVLQPVVETVSYVEDEPIYEVEADDEESD